MRKVLLWSSIVIFMCIRVCTGQYSMVSLSENPDMVVLVSPFAAEPERYDPMVERKIDSLFDSNSNILQYQKENGMYVTCLWGYNYSHPVARVDNATYLQVIGILGVSYEKLQAKSSTELETIFQALRGHMKMKDSLIYSYTYSSWDGLTSVTSPGGIKTAFEYDNDGHLCNVSVKWTERLVQEP